jgi:hypothetical protein
MEALETSVTRVCDDGLIILAHTYSCCCRYTTDQELKKFGHTQIPDDPQHDPVIPFEEGTISYAGEY